MCSFQRFGSVQRGKEHLETRERVQTLRQVALRCVQFGNVSGRNPSQQRPLANHLHHLLRLRRLLLDLDDASEQIADRLLRVCHVRFGRTTDFGLVAHLQCRTSTHREYGLQNLLIQRVNVCFEFLGVGVQFGHRFFVRELDSHVSNPPLPAR